MSGNLKQRKLTSDETKSMGDAANAVFRMIVFSETPEGHSYWYEIYSRILASYTNGTNDGKKPEAEPVVEVCNKYLPSLNRGWAYLSPSTKPIKGDQVWLGGEEWESYVEPADGMNSTQEVYIRWVGYAENPNGNKDHRK